MRYGIIYKITNKIDNKIYIGQTISSLKKRLTQHFSCKRNTYFSNAIRKYDRENFIAEELCSATNLSDLNYLEEFFIQDFNSLRPNGYNIELGGDNFKRVRSPMRGRKHSEETRKKMSAASLGKPKSAEHISKMVATKTGKPQSKESNEKRRKTMTGKIKRGRQIVCNETGEVFISVLDASRKTGIYRTKINRQLNGKVKNTKCSLTFYNKIEGNQ